ncbi:hypothetical protein [Corallococcus exercitus]|uniref:Uncharacterized protein n=1 Tax=Corallococcus exercitus TaxID=2316736 RepID=A0A7Y4JUJ9_9BACT|nr:hypothetical protein [Corallococcus exercitus]NOK11450.1 hypothetical protein [Corallococcus exercitus]
MFAGRLPMPKWRSGCVFENDAKVNWWGDMESKISVFNSSSRPRVVVIEPLAEDYVLSPGETLVFAAEDVEGEFYFAIDVRGEDEVLIYTEGMCGAVVARTRDGERVEFGYNRHLNPSYPKIPE